MNKIIHFLTLPTGLAIVFVIGLATSAFGQKTDGTKNADATTTTNARGSGK